MVEVEVGVGVERRAAVQVEEGVGVGRGVMIGEEAWVDKSR